MERTLLTLSLVTNLIAAILLAIDVQILDNYRTQLRIARRQLARHARREGQYWHQYQRPETGLEEPSMKHVALVRAMTPKNEK